MASSRLQASDGQALVGGTSSRRLQWMDVLRGTAMAALLLWHASSIPSLYSDIPAPDWLMVINSALSPYRMPTLMMLSGMLLHRSLSKPLGEFYLGKIRTLLWPYGVWAVILLAIQGRLDSITRPQDWIPVTYIWFLLFVFLYYCAAPLLKKVPAELVVLTALVLSIVIADRGFISKFVLFSAYFYLGYLINRKRPALHGHIQRAAIPLAVLSVVLLVLVGTENPLVLRAISVTGVLGFIGLCSRWYRPSRPSGVVESVGRSSIVYYLAHFPVMVGVTSALDAFGVQSAGVHIALGLTIAALLCAVLARGQRLPVVRLLFSLPALRSRRDQTSPAQSRSPQGA